jgi:hypothetical protein
LRPTASLLTAKLPSGVVYTTKVFDHSFIAFRRRKWILFPPPAKKLSSDAGSQSRFQIGTLFLVFAIHVEAIPREKWR